MTTKSREAATLYDDIISTSNGNQIYQYQIHSIHWNNVNSSLIKHNNIIANLITQQQQLKNLFYTIAQQMRNYCTITTPKQPLTHVDETGKARMVDVAAKDITLREACACATVAVGPRITQLIHSNNMSKGDVLNVAKIAGILGAKKTSELIPLCHNIVLSSVKVEATLNLDEHCVEIKAKVRCCGQTGVEMEALTAVSVAALTVYDMCKAVSHDITIKNVRLWSKSGGKRHFQRSSNGNKLEQ